MSPMLCFRNRVIPLLKLTRVYIMSLCFALHILAYYRIYYFCVFLAARHLHDSILLYNILVSHLHTSVLVRLFNQCSSVTSAQLVGYFRSLWAKVCHEKLSTYSKTRRSYLVASETVCAVYLMRTCRISCMTRRSFRTIFARPSLPCLFVRLPHFFNCIYAYVWQTTRWKKLSYLFLVTSV